MKNMTYKLYLNLEVKNKTINLSQEYDHKSQLANNRGKTNTGNKYNLSSQRQKIAVLSLAKDYFG